MRASFFSFFFDILSALNIHTLKWRLRKHSSGNSLSCSDESSNAPISFFFPPPSRVIGPCLKDAPPSSFDIYATTAASQRFSHFRKAKQTRVDLCCELFYSAYPLANNYIQLSEVATVENLHGPAEVSELFASQCGPHLHMHEPPACFELAREKGSVSGADGL